MLVRILRPTATGRYPAHPPHNHTYPLLRQSNGDLLAT